MSAGRLLLISATEFEVEPLAGGFRPSPTPWLPGAWRLRDGEAEGVPVSALATGVGKANAAAAAALAVSHLRPAALLLVGIGGAYPGAGLALGDAAVASSETHLDSGVGHGEGWQGLDAIGFPLLPAGEGRETPVYNRIELGGHVARIARRLGLPALPFGTAESVTAGAPHARLLRSLHAVAVESMEGAAVAQVAAAFGLPLLEVRGVSNVVGDRDKARWRIAEAVTASCDAARQAAPLLLEAS